MTVYQAERMGWFYRKTKAPDKGAFVFDSVCVFKL
jgi:hypothetical protein